MEIIPVPCRSDNYAYLVIDTATKTCAAVDPVWPDNVIDEAKRQGVEITCVLTTHHHHDHAGGNNEMKSRVLGLDIYGGKGDNCQGATKELEEGDSIKLGKLNIDILQTPCHTRGHLLYVVKDPESGNTCLFSGDTLFTGGCGRFFAGTPAEMHDALNKKIAKLPLDTLIYTGHEYTVSNLTFARTVEPENKAVESKLSWAKTQRAKGLCTQPSTLEEELSYNPFMRVETEAVVAYTTVAGEGKKDPVSVMGQLRESKNNFRG